MIELLQMAGLKFLMSCYVSNELPMTTGIFAVVKGLLFTPEADFTSVRLNNAHIVRLNNMQQSARYVA